MSPRQRVLKALDWMPDEFTAVHMHGFLSKCDRTTSIRAIRLALGALARGGEIGRESLAGLTVYVKPARQ